MAEDKSNDTITIEGLDLLLMIIALMIFLKFFVLTGCPCGCGAMSSMWCSGESYESMGCGSVSEDLSENMSKDAMTTEPDVDSKLKPTIYYHYTEWCGYCKKMKPLWNNVKAKMGNHAFFIENDEDKNRTPNVNSYPTVIAHVNGQQIKYNSGYTESELTKFVQNAIDMKAGQK